VILLNPKRTPLFPDGTWLVGRYLSAPAVTALLATELYVPAVAEETEGAKRIIGYVQRGLKVRVMGGAYRVRDEHKIRTKLMYLDESEQPIESFTMDVLPLASIFRWGSSEDPIMREYLARGIYVFTRDPGETDHGLNGKIEIQSLTPRGSATPDLIIPVSVEHMMDSGEVVERKLLMAPHPQILRIMHSILAEISGEPIMAAPEGPPAEA
jgi:hypothetical protein